MQRNSPRAETCRALRYHNSTTQGGRAWSPRALVLALLAGWCGYAAPSAGAAAARSLDVVTFTLPVGWSVQEHDGHVVLSRADDGNFCMVVIYASTPAGADLNASFAAEWHRVALQTIDPVPIPVPSMQTLGGTRSAVGGTVSKAQGQPVMAIFIVLDAGASVASLLVLSPSIEGFNAYKTEFEGFLTDLVVRRDGPPPATPISDSPTDATPAPASTRPLAVADLAGDWGRNDGINTRYVDRQTGAYAGTDSIHFTEKWSITAEGKFSLDFYGIQNGRRIKDTATGTVRFAAPNVLVITLSNERHYVVRGWEDAPDMTVITLNGPWYDGDIPANILSNPAQGANLDQKWVRLKKKE